MTCGASGGYGIGAGHECICTATAGHGKFYGRDHGCNCGALWNDPEPHVSGGDR